MTRTPRCPSCASLDAGVRLRHELAGPRSTRPCIGRSRALQRLHAALTRFLWRLLPVVIGTCVVLPGTAGAQALTGALIGTVDDAQGGALQGAVVRLGSPALIGGPSTSATNDVGQWRFPALPPGRYVIDIEVPGFEPYHEEDVLVRAGATIARTAVMQIAGRAESVVVEGAGSQVEARDSGIVTRFGPEHLGTIPTRRSSMFDLIRAAPGVSPTSPGSGTVTTVSAFGSGTNENQFLFDGTNFTCPCNGVARAEPGVDFIQEIQVQSAGASAEFGNVQGAVFNVVTRQGGERFLYDASYYAQAAGLTAQPVRLPYGGDGLESGYERARYRDFTTNLGGPAIRERLWFFAGYQYLRDHDSQPGTDPGYPRVYEQDKVFAKLTWRLAPGWQLMQSFHEEFWLNPEQPTRATPFDATLRRRASVPARTFGHLTHTVSSNTLWDVRVGRFDYSQENTPGSGSLTTPSRLDLPANITRDAPREFGALVLRRTTAKTTISHYRPGFLRADHEWKAGVQVETGEHRAPAVIPTGVRFVYSSGQPSQSISSAPSNTGGQFVTASAFLSDAVKVGHRVVVNAGVRFDHSRAISQDLHAVDLEGGETDAVVEGSGTLYTWNVWSPRVGVTVKLSDDGKTVLRASYGRFSQGVLTGELAPFHPGATAITTRDFVPSDGDYTRVRSVVDPRLNLRLDPAMRAPRTDEFSVGVDREVGRRLSVAVAYVRKDGANFIGWTDIGGQYREEMRVLADGRSVPVFVLVNPPAARRFLLTNPDGYAMTYNGLVMSVERRRSQGWQGVVSYTLSRVDGLQAASGTTAAGAQVSTVAPPPAAGVTFGRDPNDLTNARGLLPNDRPHVFRTMGSVEVPGTGLVVAANLGHYSGKPWAATASIALPQNAQQRVQLERRGSRRLSSQTLLDLRVSRTVHLGRAGRIELLLDALNLLNDHAEEGLVTDTLVTDTVAQNRTFGRANVFMDPRRAMLGVRLNLGR